MVRAIDWPISAIFLVLKYDNNTENYHLNIETTKEMEAV